MPSGLGYTLTFKELVGQMSWEQKEKAEEIVYAADSLIFLTCDEVEEIYYKVFKGELT